MATRLSHSLNKFKTENLSGSNYFQNTMGNSKNYNNSLYDSGELSPNNLNIPAQYHFKERNGRLKWKEIMKLDIEAIIHSNDLSPLENYLENLIFASIEDCDLEQLPDSYVVKLIKIFQYIMEYLLYTQQRLENENKTFESKYTLLVNEAYTKEEVLKENKILINTLRKDKKEKEMVLHTYKCLIDEYKSGKIQTRNDNVRTEKKYFYCDMCEGKKFSSQENLDSHLNRRHIKVREEISTTQKIPQQQIEQNSNLDEKFDQMKIFFESYVKNFAQESYLKIFENQKNLENKLYEIKYEKLNEVKDVENQFRNTLMEMKELYLKSNVNMAQIGNSYHGSNNENHIEKSNIKPVDEDKTFEKIKNETQKMSEVLTEINREQNEKIQILVEQITSFKNSINQEFKEIKESSKESDMKKKEKKIEKEKIKKLQQKEKLEKEEKKKEIITPITKKVQYVPEISHIESIEIKTDIVNNKIIQQSPKANAIIKEKKKPFFNAGPLESDHEIEGEIKSKKSLYVSRAESVEMTRKFSFAKESSLPESDNNNAVLQIDTENVKQEKIEPRTMRDEEQIDIMDRNLRQDDQDEIYAPEMEVQPEEYYRPAEFSVRNKINDNLRASEDNRSPALKQLDTIGNVTDPDYEISPEEELNNNDINLSSELNEIPRSKAGISVNKYEDQQEPENEPDFIEETIPIKEQSIVNDTLKQIEALRKIEDFYSKMEERDSNSIEKNDAALYAHKIM